MKTIWKIQLELAEVQEVEVPAGIQILSVQAQNNRACLWFSFPKYENEPIKMVKRQFRIVGTGQSFEQLGPHIGTVQLGEYVFHIFEEH